MKIAGRVLLVLMTLGAFAVALVGKNGYVATSLFSLSEAEGEITYDTGFSGMRWEDMDVFALGPAARTSGVGEEAALAVNDDGEFYLLVYGMSGIDYYTGIVSFDGMTFRHICQDQQLDAGVPWLFRAGGSMRAVTIAPVTAGRFAAGDLLVVRTVREEALYDPEGDSGETTLEILAIDPASGERTVVYAWESTVNANARIAVDASGTIYALQFGVIGGAGAATSATIQKLTWNGSGYDDTTLTTDVEGGVLLGPDGDLYTFADHYGYGWGSTNGTKPEILRVNPVTGAASAFAEVDARAEIHDWTFDSDGKLWIALDDGRKYGVTEAPIGGTVAPGRGAIATWSGHFANLTAGAEGRLYVAEALSEADADIGHLDPETDSGNDGGGKGGGKGKNK